MHATSLGIPTCYYIGDLWLSNWRSDSWLSRGAGTFVPPRNRLAYLAPQLAHLALKIGGVDSKGSLDLRHVQFASGYLKSKTLEAGEPVTDAKVLHWGIHLEKFPFKQNLGEPLRMLCVGQVVPHKGLDTAIEALAILAQTHEVTSLRLTIAGGSVYPDYFSAVHEKVRSLGLEEKVDFVGIIPREELPHLYRAHDILLFPSLIDEGLGLSILEAMGSGLVVLGTGSGGSSEILIHERTGLVFPKEDASTCAGHVLRLMTDRPLFESLRRAGRRTVEDYFEMGRLMNDLEQSLRSALIGRSETGSAPPEEL